LFIASNFQIVILTYNRSYLLRDTIKSIINQTVFGYDIIVYDNGSIDNTKIVVEEFVEYGVQYYKKEINDHLGAWDEIKNICSREWLIVFHDDDIMHPEYIQSALQLINKYPDISLICSGMRHFENINNIKLEMELGFAHYNFNKLSGFANLLYNGFPIPFCSAIYKSSVFKSLKIEYNIYDKLFDRPFLMNASAYGRIVVLKRKFIYVRSHTNQDSNTISNGKYTNAIISLNKFYYKALGCNIFTKTGRTFLFKSYNRLYGSYLWMGANSSGKSFFEFLRTAQSKGAISNFAIIIGFFYDFLFGFPIRFIKKFI